MNMSIIVIGGGGHARTLIDILDGQTITGITELNQLDHQASIKGIPVIGDDQVILRFKSTDVSLANGIGTTTTTSKRKQQFDWFKARGYSFIQVIHSSSIVAKDAALAEGVQLLAGSIIQPGCVIGLNTLVNTRASVDHDCKVGDHVHLAPGVILCGDVTVGDSTLIGAGSTILPGLRIGSHCLIGAGSVVTRNVPDGVKVLGVPAKVVRI
jgi:sugar O-acyltransferase (sialic acid O-acetyltransferase NeuD family)